MKLTIIVLSLLVSFLVACAPAATTPTPIPTTPEAPPMATIAPTPVPPKISPEEADWQKVIEAAKKEGKATFYAAGYGGETGIQVRKAFKERYGVDLDLITGRGAEFTERLKTERRMGSMVADVFQSSVVHTLNLKNLDLLEVPLGLPVLRNKGDFLVGPFLDKDNYVLIYLVMLMGPMINTNLVKPGEEPRSWQDMLNPKWKGKIMCYNPMVSTGAYQALIPLLNAKAITLEWLRDIGKQDLVLTFGDEDTAGKLSRGEYPTTLVLTSAYAGPYAKEGAPIKAIPIAEGNTVSTSTICQIKNAPHPNAAKLFLNWTLSPEGQTIYHKSRGTSPVRKDVPDFQPQALALPPTAKLVLETESDVGDEAKKFTDRWLIELWKK